MSTESRKIEFLDSAYFRRLDIMLNYSSLASSLGTGFLFGDASFISQIISPSIKKYVTYILVTYDILGPAIIKEILERNINADDYYRESFKDGKNTGSESIHEYPFRQLLRNFYSGAASFFLTRAYQNNSVGSALTGLAFVALAGEAEFRGRKEKNKLDSVISSIEQSLYNQKTINTP